MNLSIYGEGKKMAPTPKDSFSFLRGEKKPRGVIGYELDMEDQTVFGHVVPADVLDDMRTSVISPLVIVKRNALYVDKVH